ncbi:Pro-opiomelanocortin [Channa argus]|uniref:Pro-opiomelanocortin n=1 Tax=Channa argus TaxID=215402 RepID=A0A6G1QL71_CHAAH|nr:Pro-opiomelanocortin [Channa argus]KAK2890172.1 hypothetical protein Q8A73_018472 [Channa argus]
MVCLCWITVVIMVCACVPGFGSLCRDSSISNDLSNKGRIVDCIHLCLSVMQNKFPLALKVNNDEDLLLCITLATLAFKDKPSEPDLKSHGNKRRSYSMEHFRWGKPSGDKTPQPKLRAQNNKRRSYTMEHFRWGKPSADKIQKLKTNNKDRRSYTMEHFRWGKPPGRKRRPIKAFASSLEGGDTSKGSFLPLARRQLSEEAKKDQTQNSPQDQQLKRMKVSLKKSGPLSLQGRKYGTYNMSHFRWGGPPASKRNNAFMKPWERETKGQMVNAFRNIIVKDVQRVMGQIGGRKEEEGGLV